MIINDKKIIDKLKSNEVVKNKKTNMLYAFLFGGLIGLIGQLFYELFLLIKINNELSTLFVSALIMILSFILTCIGIFDKIAYFAKAGILIPISGFANSITSSALEGKTEGLIFGIGSKMFSLIGSVCTYGIVSSIILGLIYYFIRMI